MRRIPVIAFGALVAATVAAFFVTQHLKVTTPLIAGSPSPSPPVINPLDGGTCGGVDHRVMRISFYLLHRSDDVDVYVIDQSGAIIRTLASGRHMRRGVRHPDGDFLWNGRGDNGRLAPDGVYNIEVALIHQGRNVVISNAAGPETIAVKTVPPHPVVTSVSPSLIPTHGAPVRIRFAGNEKRLATVDVFRTDLPGRPRLVKSFVALGNGTPAVWDGLILHRPAAAGTYLIGLDVTDAACNTGHFPVVLPPPPGTTPHAGVTVRYLAAEPPLTPVTAASKATVYVDARQRSYRWTLRRQGAKQPLASGAQAIYQLHVKLPARKAGLYELSLSSGAHATEVPLVADSADRSAARILVVLPAFTWQGQNPVDDDGDGMPNTLDAGGPIQLSRPLANGVPSGFADEAALLAYLDRAHLAYDLTTDVALIDGTGPMLAGHAGVVLAGTERWLPSALAGTLRSYVQNGGHVLSLGIGSLLRGVTVRGGQALNPSAPSSVDALGAKPGALATQSRTDLISVIQDGLGIFSGTAGALQGFASYQPISVPAPARVLSAAGATSTAPSIVGYQLGRGIVVDVGLPDFGSSLAGNVNSQELLSRLWSVLGK